MQRALRWLFPDGQIAAWAIPLLSVSSVCYYELVVHAFLAMVSASLGPEGDLLVASGGAVVGLLTLLAVAS